MPLNEYDQMLSGGAQPQANEYDAMLAETKVTQKQTIDQNVYAAERAEPDRRAQALKISNQTNVPVEVVERNFDTFSKKAASLATDYDAIIEKSPGLATWLENPDNAVLGKDDIDSLSKVENGTARLVNGAGSDVMNALKRGYRQLEQGVIIAGQAYGFLSPDDAADRASESARRAKELEGLKPQYLKDFTEDLTAEAGDMAKAFERFGGRAKELWNTKTLDALKAFGQEGGMVLGEGLDILRAIQKRPEGLGLFITEQLPNAVPSIVSGTAYTAAALAAASAVGVTAAVPLAAIAATAGLAGTFSGSFPTEVASWFTEALGERKVDVTDREALLTAFRNPEMMSQIRGEAERKGLGTAGVDALASAITFGLGKLPMKAGGKVAARVGRQALRGAAELGVETLGEGVGEFVGQGLAKQDFSKASVQDAIIESIAGLGQSVIAAAAANTVGAVVPGEGQNGTDGAPNGGKSPNADTRPSKRAELPADTAEAAHAAVERTDGAMKAMADAETLQQLGAAVKESKTAKRLPEKVAELIAATTGDDTSAVYFQASDWDQYWIAQGLSPAKAADDIMGDGGKAYSDAKSTGAVLAVPLAQYVAQVAPTEHFEGLLPVTRAGVDAMSFSEGREFLQSLPGTMEALSKEAQALTPNGVTQESDTLNEVTDPAASSAAEPTSAVPKPPTPAQSAAKVRAQIEDQLVATGMSSQQAKSNAQIVEAAFRSLGERTGQDPAALFEQYGLQIGGANTEATLTPDASEPAAAPADEKVLNQATRLEPEREVYVAKRDGGYVVTNGAPDTQYGGTYRTKKEANAALKDVRESLKADAKRSETIRPLDPKREADAKKLGFDTSKVWYHGTPGGEFDYFDAGYSNTEGVVAFFTTDRQFADEFARKDEGSPTRYAVYLRAKKTFDFANKENVDELFKALGPDGVEELTEEWGNGGGEKEIREGIAEGAWTLLELPPIVNALQSAGFDSLYVNESGRKNLGVFEPDQIRSVDARFNPKSRDSVSIYAQSGTNDPRGRIRFGKNGIRIELLKDADPSTFIHELGHFYLEVLGDIASKADSSEQVKTDVATVREWLGAKEGEAITEEQHEQFARGFEAYLMEGKAPSAKLREAFNRFKTWLTSVYRTIRNLRVELTPQVRSVFDRLLATEAEIAEADTTQNFKPLFADPSAFGMTGAKAEAYTKAVAAAKASAEASLTEKLMKPLRDQQTAEYGAERERIEFEVTAEVNARPEYKALSGLRDQTTPDGQPLPGAVPMSAEGARQVMGFKKLPESIRKLGVVAADGVHPDIAAESYGFRSGKELLETLAAAPKREDLIRQVTDQRMQERRPDLLKEPTLSDEAMKSAHNDERATLLRLELEHLASNDLPTLKEVIRRVARRVPPEKAVRAQAERIVGGTSVEALRPVVYQRAEAKAAKEAGEALAKGDFDGAFEAKRRELLNHELYRASVAATETVGKSVKDFRRISQKDADIAKTRDMDLVNTARAILASFGLGRPADKSVSAYLKQIEEYDPDTYQTVRALYESATQSVGDYRKVRYDDFVAMRDSVEALWTLAKDTRQITIDGKKMATDLAKQELAARMASYATEGKPKTEFLGKPSDKETGFRYLYGIRAALRRTETWAHAMGPEFVKYIWNPISEATTRYRESKRPVLERYLEIIKPIEETLSREPIAAPELGQGAAFKNKASLLHAVLHTGNESNKSKLVRGYNWGQIDIEGNVDYSRWDAFLQRMWREGVLTKADYEFAQNVWDLNESLKPEAQKAHKAMYGFYFNEITADEVVTPFGTFRGGYVPAVADPFLAEDANIRGEKESLEKSNNSFMFPTAGRGFTKKRVEQYAAPLALDLGLVPGHLDKVLRFVHIEPAVKQVSRIVLDKGFRQQLAEIDPAVGGDMLVPWLQRSAQQKVQLQSQGWGGKAADSFFRGLRTRAGLQVMFANVVNTLQQVTGLSIAAVKVKPKHLRNALWNYVRAPKLTTGEVAEKSAFMRSRVTTQVIEVQQAIDEMVLNPSGTEKAREFAKKHAYFMQSASQNIVDVITWSGAYNQAVESGLEDVAAVREADAAVRQTQGSMSAEDISRFETGTPFVRAFTMFYSYFNMQANLLGTEFANTMRDQGLRKGAGRLLYVYSLGFAIPAVLSEILVKAAAGSGFDEDDDDDYLNDAMSIFFGSQGRSAAAMVPVVGPALMAGINAFNDKWYDDRISTSPAVAMVESAVKAPYTVYKAIADDGPRKKAARDTLTALGLATGLPLAPLARPIGYLLDVNEGNAEPTGPIDFARGLVTGRPGRP